MKEKKERASTATIKKAFKRDGSRSQKMVSFRLDNELQPYLDQEANKGRLINELLKKHYGV